MAPQYDYSNPDDPSEILSLWQSVHDEHSYTIAGVKWDRVWTVPQISMDVKSDPFNPKQFLDKTSKGGTLGDIWDRASDLSEARAEKMGGVDLLKAEADKKYSDARGGKAKRGKQAKPSRDIVIE
jgi:hypothetical protein